MKETPFKVGDLIQKNGSGTRSFGSWRWTYEPFNPFKPKYHESYSGGIVTIIECHYVSEIIEEIEVTCLVDGIVCKSPGSFRDWSENWTLV